MQKNRIAPFCRHHAGQACPSPAQPFDQTVDFGSARQARPAAATGEQNPPNVCPRIVRAEQRRIKPDQTGRHNRGVGLNEISRSLRDIHSRTGRQSRDFLHAASVGFAGQCPPDTNPLKSPVVICRVFDPCRAVRAKQCAQRFPVINQKRAQNPNLTIKQCCSGHARQAPARTARRPHENGFGLIVGVVTRKNDIGPGFAGGLGQQCISCFASGFGQSRIGFFPRPSLDPVGNSEIRAKLADLSGLARRFRSEPVVDRDADRMQMRMHTPGPSVECDEQRRGIAAARYGQNRGASPGEVDSAKGLFRIEFRRPIQQPAMACSRETRSFRISDASG